MDKGDRHEAAEKSEGEREEGEMHAADEEHKHYPTRLESDEEEEEEEIEGADFASLAKAIEKQSDYIRGLIEEFKVLRTELQENKKRPQVRKLSNKNGKKAKKGGKKKGRM